MDLDVLHSGKTCTLRVKGRLSLGEAVDQFNDAVREALANDHPFLILNLEAMPYIDSSGIGAVVNALNQAGKVGGDAKLVNPSSQAIMTLKMVHIYTLFSVFESEAAAAASCEAEADLSL